ncbi:MAG: TfoX/Sxy family protein [Undibacterium sp.]|nr:TfoX/Sxy family protein [Undibacterium sp.]
MKNITQLKGLGPKSQALLAQIGVHTAEQLLERDPYQLYAELKQRQANTSLNMLYALIGAQENLHWLEIKKHRRTEILLRLDDMRQVPRIS